MKRIVFSSFAFILSVFVLAQEELSVQVYYSPNDFSLSPSTREEIRNAFYDAQGGEFDVTVVGHTDNTASEEYNQKLSQLRAKQVAEYIRSLVVDVSNISARGDGEVSPLDGAGEEPNAEDRRVDIYATYNPLKGKDLDALEEKIANAQDDYVESDELSSEFDELLSREEKKVGEISLSDGESRNVEDIDRNDVKAGDKIIFPFIQFKPDKDKFLRSSNENLEDLYDLMIMNENLNIEIQGHVCCGESGTDKEKEYISVLSELRAKAVYDYLVDRGIDPDRMTYVGYGFDNPLVYPEENEGDRVKNRRVEVEVLRN